VGARAPMHQWIGSHATPAQNTQSAPERRKRESRIAEFIYYHSTTWEKGLPVIKKIR